MHPDRQRKIRELFDEYIEMYAGRDDRLTARFSQNFSGYPGSGSRLIKDREEWGRITRQDFAQVPGRIRMELLDLQLQELCDDVVVTTAFSHIHLPSDGDYFSTKVVRLTLVFRREGDAWMIVHCSYSVPYQSARDGEVFPLHSLQEQNSALQALVAERTQSLHDSQALYRLLTEDAQDVLWRTDARLIITYISPADERLRGFRADEVVGHHMFNDEGVAVVKAMIQRRAQEEAAGTHVGFLNFQAQHRCKDGRLIWGEVLSKPDRDTQGEIIGYHGITREITERKRLDQAMSASKRSHRHGALLIEVGERLKTCVREADTVARFGGDEFVVLLCELATPHDEATAQAAAVAEKIRTRLAEPYVLQAAPSAPAIGHQCTASIGVAVFHGRDESQNSVIDQADAAMYQAKEEGRNRIRFAPGAAEAG